MAKGVVFNGALTYKPGVYVESVFQTLVGRPAGAGVLAVAGNFDFLESKQPYFAQSLTQLRAIAPMAEELQKIANLVYSPGADPNMAGVPSGIYLISPTDTTQAFSLVEDSIRLESSIWGPLGNLTVVNITPDAITGGQTVTISNSGYTEPIRVPNAEGVLTLAYTVPTLDDADAKVVSGVVHGTDTVTLSASHGWSVDNAVEFFVGPGGVLPTGLTAETVYYVKSPSGADFIPATSDSGGANTNAAITTNGTLPFFAKLVSARLTAKGFDTVTAETNSGGIDVKFSKTLTDDYCGATNAHNSWEPNAPINGVINVTPEGSAELSTGPNLNVRFVGLNHLGAATTETVVFSIAEIATPGAGKNTTTSWSSVTSVQVFSDSGNIEDLSDGGLIFTGKCFTTFNEANGSKYVASVMRAVNRWSSSGFAATTLSGKTGSIEVARLDIIASPDTLPATFDATISTLVDTINAQSAMVDAEVLEYTALTLSSSTDFLLGGGSATAGDASDYNDCFTELKRWDIDGVAAVSTDATVHSYLLSHCVYMQGNGRNDRQGFIGAASLESYSQLAARLVALNTGNADVFTAFCDDTYVIGPTGAAAWLGPEYTAVQAASLAIGNLRSSLTRKRPRVLAHRRATALQNDDSENDLIRAGYTILATPAGGVPSYLRWVTAWLEDENDIRTDGAAVRSRMIMYKALRSGLDPLIGTVGTTATQALIESRVIEVMDQLVRNGEVTRWDRATLTVEQTGNTWNVGLEAQPASTVLFIGIKATLAVPTT